MSGRLAVDRARPRRCAHLTQEAHAALCRPRRASTAMRPISTACRCGRTRRAHASDNREEGARAQAALRHAAEGADVAVVSGGDPGVFAMAASVLRGGRERAGCLARARHRHRAGHHRHAGGRGPRRRAARPRFLRAVAVRQSQALGADRAAPRRGGLGGLRHRPLQSGLAARGPGSSARRSRCCRGICRARRR